MANPPPELSNLGLSQAAGVSAMLPTYSVKLAEITNNSPSDSKEETLSITLRSNFIEAVKESYIPWYDTNNYINNLRIRLIICTDEEVCKRIDYVQQRVNEYLSGVMGKTDPAAADLLPDLFLKSTDSDTIINDLMKDGGPFDAGSLTQKIKDTGRREHSYTDDERFPEFMENVLIIDIPVQNTLPVNQNGRISRRNTRRVTKLSQPDGSQSSLYSLEEIPTTPITFEIGLAQQFKSTNLTQFSVYAFTYFDMRRYDESQGRRQQRPGRGPFTVMESGIGYISPTVFSGIYTRYGAQDRTVFTRRDGQIDVERRGRQGVNRVPLIVGFADAQPLAAPDSSRLHNFSSYTNRAVDSLQNRIFEYMDRSIDRSYIGSRAKVLLADNNYFSPLWLSKDTNEDIRYSYAFSLRSYMMNNSKYPWLYINSSSAQELFTGGTVISSTNEDGVDERTHILATTMTKSLLNFDEFGSSNKLGSISRTTEKKLGPLNPQTVIASPTSILNLDLGEGVTENVAIYEGRDVLAAEKLSQQLSRIQYSVNYVIKDSAEIYISKYIKILEESQREVTKLYNFIVNSPPAIYAEDQNVPGIVRTGVGLFDYETLTREIPMERIAIKNTNNLQYRTAADIINTQIDIYLGSLEGFGIPYDLVSLKQELQSLSNSPNTVGLQLIASSIGDLASSLSGIIGDGTKRFINDGSQDEKSILEGRGFCQRKLVLLQVDHKFDNFATSGLTFGTGYEYIEEPSFSLPSQGLPRISPNDYINRVVSEFNKYFYIPSDSNLSEEDAAFSSTYENSSISFLTPQVINTYGKNKIIQTNYRNGNGINTNYDLNRYGELFSDLLRIKKESTFLNGSYYLLSDSLVTDSANQRLFNTSLQTMVGDYYCDIKFDSLLDVPSINPPSVTPAGHTLLEVDLRLLRMLPMIYGGGSDRSFTSTYWLDLIERSTNLHYPSSINNDMNKQLTPPSRKEGYPIKTMFNILGELELNDTYRELPQSAGLSFNSMKDLALLLGLNEANIKDYIEGIRNSGIPNQYKSMFVTAVSSENLSLGSGFEAVRNLVKEEDLPISVETSISMLTGDSQLPYGQTYDTMKIYSKMLAYWMNYKQLCIVEYLSGFDKTSPDLMVDQNRVVASDESIVGFNIIATNPFVGRPRMPVWKTLDPGFLLKTGGLNRLCRVRKLIPSDISSNSNPGDKDGSELRSFFDPQIFFSSEEIFNLPTYNQYFILGESSGIDPVPGTSTPDTPDTTLGGLVGRSNGDGY